MKLRRTAALSLAAIMTCTTLAACSNGESQKATTAAPEVTTQAANAAETKAEETKPASTEPQVLTVTTWDNAATPQFSTVITAYEKKNPNVKIEVIDTVAAEYNNSLGITLSAAGADPDVIWVKDMGSQLQMADKEQLMPIDDLIERDKVDLAIYKGAAEQLKYNDHYYSLPYRSDWYVLYYNKDIFDAASTEYPSNNMTWQEYYDLAAKMTSGEGSAKIYGSHNHTWQALVSNWAVQDGKHSVVEQDYSFMKKWYEEALALQESGYIQDYSTLKTANIHYSSVFKNQQCAMMPMGTWFVPTLMKAQQDGEIDFNWGVAAIPHLDDTDAGYTVGAVTPLAISAYTDQKELAWDFVKFATSEEAADILAADGVFTCIQTDKSMDLITSGEFFPEGESNVEALGYKNLVFDRPLDPKIEEIRKPLDEVHEMIMIKAYTIDEGIAELTQRVKEIKGW